MRGATAFEVSTTYSPKVKTWRDRGRRLFDAIVTAMLFTSFVSAFITAIASSLRKLLPTFRFLTRCGRNSGPLQPKWPSSCVTLRYTSSRRVAQKFCFET
ncbi:hypothetical protein MRX96_044523 [Rhipicephalus microplus]